MYVDKYHLESYLVPKLLHLLIFDLKLTGLDRKFPVGIRILSRNVVYINNYDYNCENERRDKHRRSLFITQKRLFFVVAGRLFDIYIFGVDDPVVLGRGFLVAVGSGSC